MSNNASNVNKSSDDSSLVEPKNGYDIIPYGMDTGHFEYIHIAAIICMMAGLLCSVLVITISFRKRSCGTFFTKWTKSERFVIYMAMCDGMFNIVHSFDHYTMLITRDHVRPMKLCEFYAFNLTVFICAQMLLVNVVAINIFMLMYYNKNLNFGRRDWKLLLYIFGTSFVLSLIAAVTNQYGPAGISCYFDSITGDFVMWLTSFPTIAIVVINIVLYVLTWSKIRQQAAQIKQIIQNSSTAHASNRTARNMSLFVAAFIIQWWPLAVYCLWYAIDQNVRVVLNYLCVTFSNLGGCLNLAVYLMIRREPSQKKNNSACNSLTVSRESIHGTNNLTKETGNDIRNTKL